MWSIQLDLCAMWRGIRLSFLTVFFNVEECGFGLQFKLISKPFICTGVGIKPIWLEMVQWLKKSFKTVGFGFSLHTVCLLPFKRSHFVASLHLLGTLSKTYDTIDFDILWKANLECKLSLNPILFFAKAKKKKFIRLFRQSMKFLGIHLISINFKRCHIGLYFCESPPASASILYRPRWTVAWRSWASYTDFQPWSLYAEISSDSFDDIMYCRSGFLNLFYPTIHFS